MMKFENVFVPLDFSTSSGNALQLGRTLLAPNGQLHLAHVHPRLPDHVKHVLFPYAPLGEDEADFEWESLQIARQRINAFHHLQDIDVQLGDPRHLLPELIQRNAADLVVISAFGDRTPTPDALGANTERVLRTVRPPILIARPHQPAKITNILVAVDLTPATTQVLQAALALALTTQAQLELLHVLPDPIVDDIHGLIRNQVKFDRKQAISKSKDKVDALFERAIEGLDIPHPDKDTVSKLLAKRRIHAGAAAAEILERAEKSNADLIVVGSQKPDPNGRIRLGTVAQTVARRAHTHVLVVPVSPVTHDADES